MSRDKVIVERFNPFVVFAGYFMDGLQYDRAQVNSVHGHKCATDAKTTIGRCFHAFAPLLRLGEQADNVIDLVEAGVGNCEPSTIERHGLSSSPLSAFEPPLRPKTALAQANARAGTSCRHNAVIAARRKIGPDAFCFGDTLRIRAPMIADGWG
jgi:hypothetical protein